MDVPTLMATQHPDSASRYFSIKDEVEEAVKDVLPHQCGGFGCDEKMIDYEGKLTPFLQPVWILKRIKELNLDLKVKPGKDFLLSVRCSSFSRESPERHIISLLSAIMANVMSTKEFNICTVKYIIHPMTLNVYELIGVQRRIIKLSGFAREELGLVSDEEICVIPLVEDINTMLRINELIESYITMGRKFLGAYFDHIRVFLGKSDSALAYGHLTSAVGIKIALSKLWELANEMSIGVFPIIGSGTLPFRGHLSPDNVDLYTKTYLGYYTLTLQTSFRYDYERDKVLRAIDMILSRRGKKVEVVEYENELIDSLRTCTLKYLETILRLSDIIIRVSDAVPSRRERVERQVYGRELGNAVLFTRDENILRLYNIRKVVLPRAIRFTAALYTIGIPPSVIGLGRAFRDIQSKHVDELLEIYPMLEADIRYDAQFTALNVTRKYVHDKTFTMIMDDVRVLKDLFDVEFVCEEEYEKLLLDIHEGLIKNKDVSEYMTRAAKIRRALG